MNRKNFESKKHAILTDQYEKSKDSSLKHFQPINVTQTVSKQIMPPPPPRNTRASVGCNPFHHSSRMALQVIPIWNGDGKKDCVSNQSMIRRTRTGSLDERQVFVQFPDDLQNDPTLELPLTNDPKESEQEFQCETSTKLSLLDNHSRQRSMSCSGISSIGFCDTIVEESTTDGNGKP